MYMLLTEYQKSMSKTREKSLAINSTTCLASRKITSREFPITQMTGCLLSKHLKERMSNNSPPRSLHFTPQRGMSTEDFSLVIKSQIIYP